MSNIVYDDIDALSNDFRRGQLEDLPNSLKIGNISYHRDESQAGDLFSIINDKKLAFAVYMLDSSRANKDIFNMQHTNADDPSTVQNSIVFIWKSKQLNIMPYDVRTWSSQRLTNLFAMTESEENNNRIIGDLIDITLVGINNNEPFKGRVDTGATICSLHADKVNVSDNEVQFIHNNRKYSMNLVDTQAIKTADGGVENRPVIKFNVRINNEVQLSDVQFNLNDRSGMEDQVLIGQNLLEKGKFLIDPTMEDITYDQLYDLLIEEFKDIIEEEKNEDTESHKSEVGADGE